MFLSKFGSSKKFRFEVIYSALQKSLRRGDLNLSLEMVKEFKDYPNALKKRLIQNCCEDCLNIYLVNDIYNTKPVLEDLIQFVPAICSHIKCREGLLAFRVACDSPHNSEPFSKDDNDLLTMACKCYYILCKNNNNGSSIIEFFQQFFPDINLNKIYNFIGKNRTFLYMLYVWKCLDYVTNKNYDKPPLPDDYDINKYNVDTLPDYVYDKHVSSSPKENKTYEFFIKHCILYPRKEKTELEIRGEELYLKTNKSSTAYIKPIIDCLVLNDYPIKLIQTQLITGRFKQRVYYCDINNKNTYKYILKGPFVTENEMDAIIFSDSVKKKMKMSYVQYRKVKYNDGFYLLCKNLIKIDPSNVIEKQSKLEKSIIYNGELFVFKHDYLKKFTNEEFIELFKALLFRKVIGTNDTCTRNLLYCNNIITSIDDPALFKTTDYMWKTPVNEKIGKIYTDNLKKNFSAIKEFIKEFEDFVNNNTNINNSQKKFMLNQLKYHSNINNWKFVK